MELCTSRALSSPPILPHRLFINTSNFHFNPSVPLRNPTHFSGVVSRTSTLLLRASFDETSSGFSKFSGEKSDVTTTVEDVPSVDNDVTLDNVSPVKENVYNETSQPEPPQDDESSSDNLLQPLNDFLKQYDIKLDAEDYSIFLYGGGALVALWLLSAIVGAIDSIPVFPKLMEVVGLGYSLWFTTRYLLFKKNRDELFSKIEELRQEVLGSSNK